MAAATYDIEIEQGATFRMLLQWLDSNESPVDLSGYTARMQIRRTHSSNVTLAEATTEDGRIVLSGATGFVTVVLPAEATAAIKGESAVYDLELESADGFVTRLIEGEVTISREVTR